MKKLLITIAIAAVGAAGLAAQQGGARYTPAPGAKDKKAVLFTWAWYMGMLRGPQETEAVVSLEQKATGTLQVNGQNCVASKLPRQHELPEHRAARAVHLSSSRWPGSEERRGPQRHVRLGRRHRRRGAGSWQRQSHTEAGCAA